MQGQPGYGMPQQGFGYGGPQTPFASWIVRVGAFLIDFAPIWVLMGIGYGIQGKAGILYDLFALVGLGWTIYNRWYNGGTTGQSIGKKATNIKLVSINTGQPIGPGMAFVRDLCHIVDGVICYVGYLFPLWDSKRQTLADKIVSTVVIQNV
jgi:uncharacterized RDD family membrane protein YckC